jgi:hypothetical protein
MFGSSLAPPPKSRKPLIVALCVAAAVVVVVLVIVVAVTSGGGGGAKAGSPSQAVKGYLEALARGDADKALSYSKDQPGSKDLLSDDILKKQIARWPITDIKILNDDGGAFSFASVHVSAKFGGQASDVTLRLTKADGWKLEHAATKIENDTAARSRNKALQTLTIFGHPTKDPAYVFPGWVDFGTSNPNLAVKATPPLLNGLTLGSSSLYTIGAEFGLSGTGQQAITSAVSTAMAQCTNSTSLAPPNCPLRVSDYTLVDGTAQWGQADTSQVSVASVNEYEMTARIDGQVTVPFSAQRRNGGVKDGTATGHLFGKADLQQNPPVVTFQ